ncbi:hypothetical protein [Viscerimonas tarda]
MKTLKLSFIFLLLGISFYSCEKDETETNRQLPLFPLNIGNTWVYEQTTYNVGATPFTTTTKTEIKYRYTIDKQKGFSSTEYADGQPISLVNNDNEGNCIEYFFDKDALVHETIFCKKNAKTNDKWICKSIVYTNGDISNYRIDEQEITCTSSDTVIVTLKGSFRCMGFSYHPGGLDDNGNPYHTMIQYFSENVGLVKYVHYEHDYGKTTLFTERVLIDYILK